MSDFLSRNLGFAAQVQTDGAVDPFGGTADPAFGVRIRAPQIAQNLENFDPDEVGGGLDATGELPSRGSMNLQVGMVMRGAGTPGTAPEYDPLLRMSSFGVNTLATAVTGTATAGTASTISLASGHGASARVGMPIVLTGGTGYSATLGNEQNWRVVTAVAGDVVTVYPDFAATPDATTTYEIPANVLYKPISSAIPFGAIYAWRNSSTQDFSVLQRVLRARGAFSVSWNVGEAAIATINGTAALTSPVKVEPTIALPSFGTEIAPLLLDAVVYFAGTKALVSNVTFDLGAEVQLADDPFAEYGYSDAAITRRRPTVALTTPYRDPTVYDALAAWKNQQVTKVWAASGPSAGGRLSIYAPQARQGAPNQQDVRGFLYEQATGPSLEPDGGMYICVF